MDYYEWDGFMSYIKLKVCPRCGRTVENRLFCPYCGSVLIVKFVKVQQEPKQTRKTYGYDFPKTYSYVVCPKCFAKIPVGYLTFSYDSDGNVIRYLNCPKCGYISKVKVKKWGVKTELET